MGNQINLGIRFKKDKQLIIASSLLIVIILAIIGYILFQHFVLKKDLGFTLLLLSLSRAQSFLIPGVIAILALIVLSFGYVKFNSKSLGLLTQKRIVMFVLVVVLAIIALIGSYFSYQYYLVTKEFGPQLAVQQETSKVVTAASKLMLLPGETPTIATVTDINKLKGQAFFNNAINGDKILIYTNAKEAILYSPSRNLIIGIAPITIGGGQNSSQTIQARIALRNGTNSVGLTNKAEADIQNAFPGANIILKDQSQNTQYASTLVIALNDVAKGASQELANKLNATVSVLPKGESAPPGVDILVIVGKDLL